MRFNCSNSGLEKKFFGYIRKEIGFFCLAYEAHPCAAKKKRINPELVSRYICVYFAKRNQPKKSIDYVQQCKIDNVCTVLENFETLDR